LLRSRTCCASFAERRALMTTVRRRQQRVRHGTATRRTAPVMSATFPSRLP
jgi:hypothetical protein